MKSLILALTFLLVPFFSFADVSIFSNGVVPVQEYLEEIVPYSSCRYREDGSWISETIPTESCISKISAGYSAMFASFMSINTRTNGTAGSIEQDGMYVTYPFTYSQCSYNETDGHYGCVGASHEFSGALESARSPALTRTCDTATFPLYNYEVDYDNDGLIDVCANPNEIPLYDDCKVGSTDQFLDVSPSSTASACDTKPNGSICNYDVVESDAGNYYALDLEGNCYTDSEPAPTGDPFDTPENDDDLCQDWGGTGLICPENPDDVCEETTSSTGGDTVLSCQEGCGEVNGVFTCLDNDLDGDSVPDYLDPDVDGDGIPNDDDLDNDGDGIDDPIDLGDDSTSSSGDGVGDVNVDVDMSGVEAGLSSINESIGEGNEHLSSIDTSISEIKDSLTTSTVTLNKKPSEELKGFYESDYEDGISGVFDKKFEKYSNTEFFRFLNNFAPSFAGVAPDLRFCFDFGTNMDLGCFELSIDPRVFPALKIFILITAGFTCRKIIFGG